MRMNPYNMTAIFFALCLALNNAMAPVYVDTLADKFFHKVDGSLWHKKRAYHGFKKWPRRFGHTQAEIWELISKETGGKFHYNAYNKRTKARSLMQVREIAIQDLSEGWRFYNVKDIGEGIKIRVLNKKRIYDPYWNLYAGCAYYALCKRRARPQKIGRFNFTKDEIAKAYYITGYGSWHLGVSATLSYMQEQK